jgi:hypothetical protein
MNRRVRTLNYILVTNSKLKQLMFIILTLHCAFRMCRSLRVDGVLDDLVWGLPATTYVDQ